MNTLVSFVHQLVAEKGVSGDSTVMDEYRADVLANVNERLNAEMIGAMTTEQIIEFNDLLHADPEPAVLREFFLVNVPEYQKIFTKTLADFRASYLR